MLLQDKYQWMLRGDWIGSREMSRIWSVDESIAS